MNKFKNIWAVAESASFAEILKRAASHLADSLTLVTLPCEGSAALYVSAVAKMVAAEKPEAVLTVNTKNGRLLAGVIAAMLDTSVLTDPTELCVDGQALTSQRMVYGGAAFRTQRAAAGKAVACIGAGLFADGTEIPVRMVEASETSEGIEFIEKNVRDEQKVNLSAAQKVVCVGRGVQNEAIFGLASQLAKKLQAELGCTRPIAEENGWLPKESYVGISGVITKPDFYMAIGISGQVQHMVGVNQAKTIIAINKDKNAPIFSQCDYGLVADAETVLPALLEVL